MESHNNNYCHPTGPLAEKAYKNQNKEYFPDKHVQFGSKGCYLPIAYDQHRQEIEELEIREDDVWICSMQRSGSTWTCEMSWLLGHDLDYETAAKVPLSKRVQLMEREAVFPVFVKQEATSMEITRDIKSPRFIRSHLPWNMLPGQIQRGGDVKPKIIYIARNPKAVAVSNYHLTSLLHGYRGSIDDFAQEFIGDLVLFGPYWTHVQEFYERYESNILFLTYENMIQNLSSVIKQTTTFLGKPSLNETQLEKLLGHLNFTNVKTNPAINQDELINLASQVHKTPAKTQFIRKGQIDSWKTELSTDSITALDEWIAEKKKSPKYNDICQLWDE